MVLELLRHRRSVRQFEQKPIEQPKLDALIETALRSPSSRRLDPWEFVVVTDPSQIEKLSRAKEHGSAFLKGAPLAIVVCADPQRCDVWVEDCSIAAILLQLTAESLHLGSCWVQVRNRPHGEGKTAETFVQEVLGMPNHLVVEAIVGIGYPAEKPQPHPESELDYGKVHFNRYGEGR